MKPLDRAVKIVGQAALARHIGTSAQLLYWYRKRTRRPTPAEWCAKIEAATAGVVTRKMLRPDIFDR